LKENIMASPPRQQPPTALDLAIRAQVEKDRMLKRPTAIIILQRFQTDVLANAEKWAICARNFGSAYTRAAKQHRDALANAEKLNQLDAQMMFSALTLLMTGPVSMIWNTNTIQQADVLIKNSLKDVLLAGFGEGFSAIGPVAVAVPPAAKDKTIADDALDDLYKEPLECENVLANRVSGWKIGALQLISGQLFQLQQKMDDDRFWDGWSQAEAQWAIDSWWDGDGRSPGAGALWGMDVSTSEKNVKDMARDLERAMWAKWIPRLRTVSTMASGGNAYDWGSSDQVGQQVENYAGVKGPIEDRFRELNILQEAGLDGIHWYNSAASEDTKLIAWANRFLAPGGHPIWNSK
jgi:hypothetical protein